MTLRSSRGYDILHCSRVLLRESLWHNLINESILRRLEAIHTTVLHLTCMSFFALPVDLALAYVCPPRQQSPNLTRIQDLVHTVWKPQLGCRRSTAAIVLVVLVVTFISLSVLITHNRGSTLFGTFTGAL